MEKETMSIKYVPAKDNITYKSVLGVLHIWEDDSWKDASLAWKKSCYIHAGITWNRVRVKGPDATKLLSRVSINNVYKWKMDKAKHLVMLNEEGLIMNHALAQKEAEDEYSITSGNPLPFYAELKRNNYDAEVDILEDRFIFQMAGPLSLTVIEKVTQESQRDVNFLQIKKVSIPGYDTEFELCRIGMSGTLSYELRGPAELAPEIYAKIVEDGREYDLKILGWRTYTVNHFEGGYPQMGCNFANVPLNEEHYPDFIFTGSIDPSNHRARYRTPGEVDWLWMADLDHDFVGREALIKEKENLRKTIVNLEWNVEDILDIAKSQYEDGEEYKNIEVPVSPQAPAGFHADLVTDLNGNEIGMSTATFYSYYYKKQYSQSIIDIDKAEIGTEVIIHWGDYGKRIKKVRAKVVRYPLLDLPENKGYDLSTVPSGI